MSADYFLKNKITYKLFASLSSHINSYHPSHLVSLLDCIQCPHRADVCKFILKKLSEKKSTILLNETLKNLHIFVKHLFIWYQLHYKFIEKNLPLQSGQRAATAAAWPMQQCLSRKVYHFVF